MDDDQVSWKGHGFTLLVFGGIVFLCSIFFVLGMLVGRGQEQRAAKAAASIESAKVAPALEESASRNQGAKPLSEIAAFQGVQTGKPVATVENALPSEMPKPVVSEPAPAVEVANPEPPPSKPPLVKMLYLQVSAVEKEAAAKKQVDELIKLGFSALFSSGGTDKLYRVQVGPFSTRADADSAKTKLKALGFDSIRK